MKILIGGVDYSSALDAVHPMTVVRKLNEPSTCRFWVSLPAIVAVGALPVPARNQGLVVTGDDGTVYFTGYLAVSPMPEFAGLGLAGPVYRLALEAVSDEILLDTQLLPPSAGTSGVTAAQVVAGLVMRTGSAALSTAGLTLSNPIGHFGPAQSSKFSVLAGQAASQARGAYRAVNGALSLAPVGAVVHTLDESAGTLELAALALSAGVTRALANDVTVCGAQEPVAYVTEYFYGDGTTLNFALTEAPFVGPASAHKIIYELFQEANVDLRRWSYSGSVGYYSITGAGLTIDGGTGMDGDAALVWNDAVEAGGTLLLEAVGVNLSLGSTGIIAGVFSGIALAGECVAGFQVSSAIGTGVVSVSPLIQGVVAGASLALDMAHSYTMRVRLYSPEEERTTQTYRVVGDAGLAAFGGGGIVSAGLAVLEVEEFVDGVGGSPVVLYDGAVGALPASFLVAAASSVNLIGTIRSVFLKGMGTGWVVSTPVGGGAHTRRIGTLADSGECRLTGTGLLEFYTGLAPAPGEIVAARYRSVGRAVGRAVNAASQAALAAVGFPATAVWTGSVTEPVGRSSLDCRNAAQALVTAAASVSAAWTGSYRSSNVALRLAAVSSGGVSGEGGADVWPGDELLLTAPSFVLADGSSLDVQVAVRQVTLAYGASSPDVVAYAIEFSNDWANDLSVKTSRTVPEDAFLPALIAPTYLANLTSLVVTAITATAVSVQTNWTPPVGGGFEVRRRDFAFRAGQDVDLVIRSAVGVFDIPRATEADRFYVRSYDGSTPPNYSEFSVGLFINLPLS